MTKAQLFLKKHSSTILTGIGAIGVVGTTVLGIAATPKALSLLVEAEQEKGGELTVAETVKAAWKPYIPTVISGVSTIVCIFGANYLSARTQASLMSAYALLDNSYKEYRKRTRELHEEEAVKIEHEIIKSKFNPDMELDDDKELFFDYESMRYFQASFEEVKQAEYVLNQKLAMDGFACLNDFYDILKIPHTAYGYQLGWSTLTSDRTYGDSNLLEFEYEKVEIDGGLECNIITISYPPSLEYIC